MSCGSRLQKAYDSAVRMPLDSHSRYVLISDCHRGTGTSNDNFLRNQHLYMAAMEYYYKNGFFYIELGDGEELWENRYRKQIEECHSDAYSLLSRFEQKNRMLRLFGNHNIELRDHGKNSLTTVTCASCPGRKDKNWRKKSICKGMDGNPHPLKEDLKECVILENLECGRNLCLLHGHQADFLNSVLWRLSRFLVRYLWKPLELFGINDPTSTAKNYKKQTNYEHCMMQWAEKMDIYLVAGHSHRPTLSGDGGLYVNTGSCVHPKCITAVEIENQTMSLVKWTMGTRLDMTLFVERIVIAGPVAIN